MNKIQFKNVDVNGTHLAFEINPKSLGYTFQEAVERINGAGPDVFVFGCDKSTFESQGTFDGVVFTLYDYKGDDMIHLGTKGGQT